MQRRVRTRSLSFSLSLSDGTKPRQNGVERRYYYPSTITTFTTLTIVRTLTTSRSRAHVYGSILLRNRLMNASRRDCEVCARCPTLNLQPLTSDTRRKGKVNPCAI